MSQVEQHSADLGDLFGRLVKRGVCVAIAKNSNADEIVAAAKLVLGDPAYLERITEMSELMGLQRHSPLEDAVWVMEYVAKTKGAGSYSIDCRRPIETFYSDLHYFC